MIYFLSESFFWRNLSIGIVSYVGGGHYYLKRNKSAVAIREFSFRNYFGNLLSYLRIWLKASSNGKNTGRHCLS